MKFQVMTGILFTLLSKRKVTAPELAEKYGCSVRSIYRYIDDLTVSGVPVDVARGSTGGIYISDTFKLPKGFFTKEEYARTRDAVLTLYEQTGDETLKSAYDKLTVQMKSEKYDGAISGNILVDSGTWGDERKFSERLTLFERAIENCLTLDVDYVDREGERSRRTIYPHLLVYKQNVWYVYAYCNKREAFRLFKLGRIRSAIETGETFERIPFSRDDIPLSFWNLEENNVDAKFEISADTLHFAEEWLGVDCVYEENGKYYADVTLPDDELLVGNILSAGAGFCVLSPESLKERVKQEAQNILRKYASQE